MALKESVAITFPKHFDLAIECFGVRVATIVVKMVVSQSSHLFDLRQTHACTCEECFQVRNTDKTEKNVRATRCSVFTIETRRDETRHATECGYPASETPRIITRRHWNNNNSALRKLSKLEEKPLNPAQYHILPAGSTTPKREEPPVTADNTRPSHTPSRAFTRPRMSPSKCSSIHSLFLDVSSLASEHAFRKLVSFILTYCGRDAVITGRGLSGFSDKYSCQSSDRSLHTWSSESDKKSLY